MLCCLDNMTSFVLEPATADDVPAMTELWFAAFTQPSIKQLFPDTPGMHEWWSGWHRSNFTSRPSARYLRVVDTASKDANGKPRLIAFGVWDLAMPDDRGRRFPEWHRDSDKQGCDALVDGLEAERKRVMGGRKHYCTHPDYQRRGAGSMLVKWGCDLADQDGVSAYVDASKEGAPLYKKHGFVDYSPPDNEVASMGRGKVAVA